MSDIAPHAHVTVIMADFTSVDAAGKNNVIGAGVDVLGFDPGQGVTSRFGLLVTVTVPGSFAPCDLALEIALLTAAGDVASLPGPVPGGDPQVVRVGQFVTLQKPAMPGIPAGNADHFLARANIGIDFAAGLPLAAGGLYTWRIQIDGDTDHEVRYPFGVAGPPPSPVVG